MLLAAALIHLKLLHTTFLNAVPKILTDHSRKMQLSSHFPCPPDVLVSFLNEFLYDFVVSCAAVCTKFRKIPNFSLFRSVFHLNNRITNFNEINFNWGCFWDTFFYTFLLTKRAWWWCFGIVWCAGYLPPAATACSVLCNNTQRSNRQIYCDDGMLKILPHVCCCITAAAYSHRILCGGEVELCC